MYSKARSTREREETVTPPPGYAGNRFFTAEERTEEAKTPQPRKKPPENLGFLSGIGREELLIIGLILILAGEGEAESDTLLMLILLLLS